MVLAHGTQRPIRRGGMALVWHALFIAGRSSGHRSVIGPLPRFRRVTEVGMRRRVGTRRLRMVTVLCAVSLVAAGCGDDGHGETASRIQLRDFPVPVPELPAGRLWNRAESKAGGAPSRSAARGGSRRHPRPGASRRVFGQRIREPLEQPMLRTRPVPSASPTSSVAAAESSS